MLPVLALLSRYVPRCFQDPSAIATTGIYGFDIFSRAKPGGTIHGLSQLTPWSRLLPEKLTDPKQVKKFPEFYGT